MSSLTVSQLEKLTESESNLVIVDIRTAWEVGDGRIPNSEWLDISSKEFMTKILALPKDKTYCLYCASGGRTSMVVPFMQENGFTKVYDLDGGIDSWIVEGKALV